MRGPANVLGSSWLLVNSLLRREEKESGRFEEKLGRMGNYVTDEAQKATWSC